jgi:hypothetical protein
MAVNHYLMTDEELIDRFCDVIESNTYVDDMFIELDYEPEIKYAAKKTKEYWDIRKEILERMK